MQDLQQRGVTGYEPTEGVYTPSDIFGQFSGQRYNEMAGEWDNFYATPDREQAAQLIEDALTTNDITPDEAQRLYKSWEDYQAYQLAYPKGAEPTGPYVPNNPPFEDFYYPENRIPLYGLQDVFPEGEYYRGQFFPLGGPQSQDGNVVMKTNPYTGESYPITTYGPRRYPEKPIQYDITGAEEFEYRNMVSSTGLSPNEKNWLINNYSDLFNMWKGGERTMPFRYWAAGFLGLSPGAVPETSSLGQRRGEDMGGERETVSKGRGCGTLEMATGLWCFP